MATTTITQTTDPDPEQDAPAPPVPSARRRYALVWTVAGAVATVFFFWLITAGTGKVLVEERVGNFHDTQVRAWLDGRWDVPPEVVTIEGFVTDGRTYLYFGPVPALLRLPLMAVTDAFDGRLTRASMLIAFVVAVGACGTLAWRTRRLVRGDDDVSNRELLAVGAMALLIGTGSVLPFYASKAWVYHETTLWAVAFTLAAFAALLGHLHDRRWRSLLLAGGLALAAMLTRGSVGIAPAVAIGVVAAVEVVGLVRRRDGADDTGAGNGRRARAAALVVAALLPFAAFAAVNLIKFHTPLSLPLDRQVITSFDGRGGASRRAALADNGGTLFGVKFLPTTILHYSRPDALGLQRAFPWVRFPGPARTVGPVTFDVIDPAASVPATTPALALLAGFGLVGIARRRALRPLVPLIVGAAAGAMTVLAFGFIAHRYLGDMFPLVVVPALAALAVAPTLRRPRWPAIGALGVLAVLAAWSVWVNTALTLDYQRFTSPNADDDARAALVRAQVAIGPRSAFDVRRSGLDPGPVGPDGQFVIVGDCDGLYRSNGDIWAPVERTPRTGHFRFRATFAEAPPGTVRQVMTAPGAPAMVPISLRWLDDGWARFETVDLLKLRNVGKPFAVAGEGSRSVDVIIDPRTTEVTAWVDGERVLDTKYQFLVHEQHELVAGWAVEVVPDPPPTPACRQLVGDSS